jgi:YD repeat-containing protein
MGATTVGTAMQWDYTYDKYGQILTVNGPRTDVSDVTTFAYYADNDTDVNKRAQLASVTNALGQITQYAAYNGYGQPLTIVDPNGVTTTRTYDARRRLLTEQTAGETTQYTYDAAGKLTRVTLPDATWVGYAYDTAGRLTQVQDSAGNRIEYTLDAAGNRTTEDTKDPSGSLRRRITRVYDALNRVQNVTGGL